MFPLAFALIVLIGGAIIGLFMAGAHVKGVESGKGVGILHGVFVLAGLALMGTGMVQIGGGWWLFVGFLVVASGGAYLFSRQMTDKPWPALVIIAHGGLAIALLITMGLWLAGATGGADNPVLPEQPEVGAVQP